jgi:hypothetical protein
MAGPSSSGRSHYSGANPIPTVKEFIDKLDVGKKDRDEKIENGEIKPASSPKPLTPGKNQKTVTDPVTGNDVVIEDAIKDRVSQVNDPTVLSPSP